MNNNRGLTIAEAVIAMALIIAVGIAAATVLNISAQNASGDVAGAEARIIARDAIEIYKHCETLPQFDGFIKDIGYEAFAGGYVFEDDDYTVSVDIDSGFDTCRVVAVTGGRTLLDITYSK